jgi:predicted esterase
MIVGVPSIARAIPATTHGRYLIDEPSASGPAPLLVGFHGYAEAAEDQLERMRAIPGASRWLLASVQALHPFYRGRSQDVVAGWMTRQDRDLAIADNVAYVHAVVDAIAREWTPGAALVFAGFSQGVAMAFRAAVTSARPVAGVIVCGGDVPPELDTKALARVPAALIGRGVRDDWYTSEKAASDARRLGDAGVRVTQAEFDGGHEWPAPFNAAAGVFLSQCP